MKVWALGFGIDPWHPSPFQAAIGLAREVGAIHTGEELMGIVLKYAHLQQSTPGQAAGDGVALALDLGGEL